MTLGPAETAQARHRLYALLGQWLAMGPTPDAVAMGRAVPALAAVLPTEVDFDDLGARHHAAMTEVPPMASALLDADGMWGGAESERIGVAYRAGGFHPGGTDVPVDHVGLTLAYVGHLCLAEAHAVEDGNTEAVETLVSLQQRFLDEHLLRFLPVWAASLEQADDPVFATVAVLALELAASHAGTTTTFALVGAPPTLGDDIGLDDLAEAIVCPARSGWVLGRTPLARACAGAGLPAGMGSRSRVLAGALHGAAALNCLPTLVAGLLDALDRWDGALGIKGETLGVPVGPWRKRLALTRATLVALSTNAPEG